MTSLKSLSNNPDIPVISVLKSIDCLFSLRHFPDSWKDEDFFSKPVHFHIMSRVSGSYLNLLF